MADKRYFPSFIAINMEFEGLYKVSGQQTCPLYIVILHFCGMRSDIST